MDNSERPAEPAIAEQRRSRVREVIADAAEAVRTVVANAVDVISAMHGDHMTARIVGPPWEPFYKIIGEQGQRDRLYVETSIAMMVERRTGTIKEHMLVLSLCRVEPGTWAPEEDTGGDELDGRIALVPVYERPGSPHRTGFLASRERAPAFYRSTFEISRYNEHFFGDARQVAFYFRASAWPECVERATEVAGDAIALFFEIAVAEPPWELGTTRV